MPKTKFAVYKNNTTSAAYAMAYVCGCGEPVIGYGDDMKGLFVGTCGNGHESTVMAS
ncbi:hypothetical protein [Nonomuraea phyllanthi]|uniref:hypothetical protein n=1 Tax=Nonomuraea phyllanthi TaxID=2219224 RepID=UPI0012938F46|nr:hypothetical protein [Nonomuraea phyllanthi]